MRSTSSCAHAGHRLVEQQHLGIERERGGDLERALAAVGQLDRSQRCETRSGRPPRSARSASAFELVQHALGAPEIEAVAALGAAARCGRSPARVMWPNTAEIWNERTSPSRATSAGFMRRDVAALVGDRARGVGCRNFVSRLKQVVLPAPFGPISAWIVPRRTFRSTLADRREALEVTAEPARRQDDVVRHHRLAWCSPAPTFPAGRRGYEPYGSARKSTRRREWVRLPQAGADQGWRRCQVISTSAVTVTIPASIGTARRAGGGGQGAQRRPGRARRTLGGAGPRMRLDRAERDARGLRDGAGPLHGVAGRRGPASRSARPGSARPKETPSIRFAPPSTARRRNSPSSRPCRASRTGRRSAPRSRPAAARSRRRSRTFRKPGWSETCAGRDVAAARRRGRGRARRSCATAAEFVVERGRRRRRPWIETPIGTEAKSGGDLERRAAR